MEWIDVNEKLPPIGKLVYVYGVLGHSGWDVGRAFLDKRFGEYGWYAEDYYEYDDVRCWLEIPTIPPVPEKFSKI